MPNTQIHYFTKDHFAGILEANPNVDKIISFKNTEKEAFGELKKENYDCVIDLHKNIRSVRVRKFLGKKAFTFDKLNWQKWVMVNFKINRLPSMHIVDRYFQAVNRLGIVNDQKGLDYFIPPKEEIGLNKLPDEFHKGYVGFVIGAAHATKALPTNKIISICNKITLPVILMGGENDYEKAKKISKESSGTLLNACGKYSLHGSASLVKQANFIITHDTGLMHIAAAFKKKIYSFWGNTIPEFGMYPYLPHPDSKIIENKNLKCRPCTKIGYQKCPKGHFKCMEELPEEGYF